MSDLQIVILMANQNPSREILHNQVTYIYSLIKPKKSTSLLKIRPLVKSVLQKYNFLISHPKHVVGTQKNCLYIETVLLSTQNILKIVGKKIFTTLH